MTDCQGPLMRSMTEAPSPANSSPAPVPPKPDSIDDVPVTVIEKQDGWALLDFRELWRYRELLWFLTWRDVKVRYKQTALGIGWAVLQPLFMMVLSSVIFGGLGNIKS